MSMGASKRFDTRINVLVTNVERRMLQDLAERERLTPSDVVRRLIWQAYREAFGDKAPKRAAKRRR